MTLAEQDAEPISADTKPLPRQEAERLAAEVPKWTVREGAIEREFRFSDFAEAMEFVNEVARMAQKQDHHPDIHVSYDRVRLEFSTHKIGGLSQNDFICAAKVDLLA